MMAGRRAAGRRLYVTGLIEASPLRRADPRAKLALSACASLAVMLPLERLAVVMALYVLLLLWARLLPTAGRQVWRLKWLLVALFALDWLFVGLDLAIVVSLRVVLLAGVFTLFVSTTTPDELRLALERLRVPYRYAFSLSLAFQSVNLLSEEWAAIHEAQSSRGAFERESGLRGIVLQLRDWVALTVPAIVLTTRRAWAMTEAACARGFDSPHRSTYRQLAMRTWDWALVSLPVAIVVALALWRM
jgi:energy-coupling factor transporter transmembrane protein EcfT